MSEYHYETPGHHFTADEEREIKDLSRHGAEEAMRAVARTAALVDEKNQMSIVISATCSAFLATMEPIRKRHPAARAAVDAMIKQILERLDYHEV